MCRAYHITSLELECALRANESGSRICVLAERELMERLEYEYMFGIITERDIEGEGWLRRCGRDVGHHMRILKLHRLSRGQQW
jgi:hypothetical protein